MMDESGDAPVPPSWPEICLLGSVGVRLEWVVGWREVGGHVLCRERGWGG